MLRKHFKLARRKTTFKQECLAGATTYLTMVYIAFVSANLLGGAGVSSTTIFVATCLVAAVGSFLCGFIANFPAGVAPGIPLIIYFAYVMRDKLHYPWETALTAVFLAAIIVLLISMTKIRVKLVRAIPTSLMIGITTGIGLFIALIALKTGGIVVSDPNTLVKLGPITSPPTLIFIAGFVLIVALDYYRIPGAILLSIVIMTLISMLIGITRLKGFFSMPTHSVQFWHPFAYQRIFNLQGLMVVFTLVLIPLFDSIGTMIGLSQQMGEKNKSAIEKKTGRALLANSLSSTFASFAGAPSTVVFIESAAGIRSGGKTGLTAIVVSLLFLLTLFFAPLAKMVPSVAIAPALLYVAVSAMSSVGEMTWDDPAEYIPSAITFIMIAFTFSIAEGVGFGIVSYVLCQCIAKRHQQLNRWLIVLAIIFLLYFALHRI